MSAAQQLLKREGFHYRPGGGRRGGSWGVELKAESVTTATRRRVAELDARILGVPKSIKYSPTKAPCSEQSPPSEALEWQSSARTQKGPITCTSYTKQQFKQVLKTGGPGWDAPPRLKRRGC